MSHILIGLGGTGGKILKAFRQRLCTEYDESKRNKLPIGFIYVDTDCCRCCNNWFDWIYAKDYNMVKKEKS